MSRLIDLMLNVYLMFPPSNPQDIILDTIFVHLTNIKSVSLIGPIVLLSYNALAVDPYIPTFFTIYIIK